MQDFAGPAATNALTLALVIITSVYAYLTFLISKRNKELVRQMMLQNKSIIEPVISGAIKIKYGCMICISVRNTGRSSAKNLRLRLDRDFYMFAEHSEEKNLRINPMFTEIIPSFASGEEIFVMISQGFNLEKYSDEMLITPSEFVISAEYEFNSDSITQTHHVNLKAYMETGQDRDELAESVKKISSDIEKIRRVAERKSR